VNAAVWPDEFVAVPFTNERSAWLREQLAARVEVVAHHLPFLQAGHVQTGINGPVPAPGTEEDRTCDRCGDVPEPGIFPFRVIYVLDGFIVHIVGGLCFDCAKREGWEVDDARAK